MEHILQFGISIDDETIKNRIEEAAVNKMAEDLKRSVRDKLFNNNRWNSSGFTEEAERLIKNVMNEYKDEIISQSVNMVVDTIKHSKKYREALANVVEEIK